MIEERWFSYPIWHNIIEYEHHKELLDYCLLRKGYDDGRILSNKGGWQSSDLFFNTDETTNKLCAFLQHYLNILSEKIKIKFKIDNLWININGSETSNQIHVHPNSYISGVFYVKAKENQGDICFKNPLEYFNEFMYMKNNFLDSNVHYKPKTGMLLLFPSSLPHFVLPNRTNIDRISIAFNTKVVKE